LSNLATEIKDAVVAAAAGQPMNEALKRDAAMAARTVLNRHGLSDATVSVRREGQSLVLEVIPPARAPHVQRIQLRLG